MTDLLASSPDTWREDRAPEPVLDPRLAPPVGAGPAARLAAWRLRHHLRREHAEHVFTESRRPVRGWPVAEDRVVWTFFRVLIADRRASFTSMVLFNVFTTVAALVVPQLLGRLVDRTLAGDTAYVDTLAMIVVGVVLAQAVFRFLAQRASTLFGQDLLATSREYVVRAVLRLPLGQVEGASTGDLVTRVTRDVGTMSRSVQWGLPRLIISALMVSLSTVAMLVNSVVLAVPAIAMICTSAFAVRRYLRTAPQGYITEGATYSRINTTLTETVEGARTVEALGLAEQRVRQGQDDLAVSAQAERYTMSLRNLLFVVIDFAFNTPRVVTLVVGAWGYAHGWVSIGQITAAMLYVEALSGPLDQLVGELDRLQVGATSTARLLGIAEVPSDRTPGDALPASQHLVGSDLRFAYREGHDVLHGIDLELRDGERLAVVGPSGSGKSTLGRLLSGINGPRTGSVTVGGVELVELPLETLRTEVALVTQEHHVFIGTVRDNIVLAREDSDDEVVWAALHAVGADGWVRRLPDELDTRIGSGKQSLTPAQAQQIALARLIIADPHTLVLDEATSLIDPRTARTLEGSMNALLSGRTVVAIAHRLHTAHDADRIAVVIDGEIAELGSHHELVERPGGEYAALWRAWTS